MELDKNSPVFILPSGVNTVSISIGLNITSFDGSQTKTSGTTTLEVEYTSYGVFTSRSNYVKKDVSRSEVSISSVTIKYDGVVQQISVPDYVVLRSSLFIERYYAISTTSSSTPNKRLLTASDELEIYWPFMDGAEYYDLEWTYVNDYSSTSGNYLPTSDLSYDFKRNSTRISTADNSYRISMTYDHGYILYRVRGVGRSISDGISLEFSNWSGSESGGVNSFISANGTSYYQNTTSHQGTMNWQYSASYAEEGKKKEVISYFDGSLRNRQVVSRINTLGESVIGETVYDQQGRAAVQILPVPVGDATLKYYTNQNMSSTSDIYNWQDFDTDNTNPCNSNLASMLTSSGASKYYSSNNSDQEGASSFIPSAGGYPFSQVEYMPDNTGRIRRQGGVGADHQLASGGTDRSTSYYYGQPEQQQLDRLFGTDVGINIHYKKNMVIDPNGQISISYLDAQGRVIATSLAGTKPTNVEALSGSSVTRAVNEIMLDRDDSNVPNGNNVVDQVAIVYSKEVLVSSAGDYTIDYDVNLGAFTKCSLSYDFSYNLEISLKNECGAEMIAGGIHDAISGPNNLTESITVPSLAVGKYTLVKRLELDKATFDSHLASYLSNSTCIKSLTTLQSEKDLTIYTDNCEYSCSTCVASLGGETYALHVNHFEENSMTEAEYNTALEACNAPCGFPNSCELLLDMLLQDVSPRGQYALYDEEKIEGTMASDYPLSLFNVDCDLPDHSTYKGTDKAWRHPLTSSGAAGNYLDANGKQAYVLVSEDASTTSGYYPDIVSTNNLCDVRVDEKGSLVLYNQSQPGSILKAVKPEYLSNSYDFISAWQASWAYALVNYHPEYCFYEMCGENNDKSIYPPPGLTSDEFDASLMTYQTWAEAVAKFSDIDDPSTVDGADDLLREDPYFVLNSTPYNTMKAVLEAFHNNVNPTPLSVKTIIANSTLGANDPNTNYSFGSSAAGSVISDSYVLGKVLDYQWEMYRSYYLTEKRKIQQEDMISRSIGKDGFNGCIEKFSPKSYTYGFINIINILSSPFVNDVNQSCHISRYTLYKDKIRRYRWDSDVSDIDSDLDNAQDVIDELKSKNGVEAFTQSGQCKMAFDIQGMLGYLIEADKFTSTSSYTLEYTGALAQDIDDACSIYASVQGIFPYWKITNLPASSSAGTLKAVLMEGAPGDVGARFEFYTTSSQDVVWGNVVQLFDFKFTKEETHNSEIYYKFRAMVIEADGNGGLEQKTIYGRTTLALNECMDENGNYAQSHCQESPVAQDLLELISVVSLQVTGYSPCSSLISSDFTNLDLDNAPYSGVLSSLIKELLKGGSNPPASGYKLDYDATNKIFTLDHSSLSGSSIEIDFTNSLTGCMYLSDFTVDVATPNTFSMKAHNSVGTTTITGGVIRYTNSTTNSEELLLPLLDCYKQSNEGCAGTGNDLRKEFMNLLNQIIASNGDNGLYVENFVYPTLGTGYEVLEQYLFGSVSYKVSGTEGPTIFYNGEEFKCFFTLYNISGAAADLTLITEIAEIRAWGVHTDEVTHDFMIRTVAGDVYFGSSTCLPLSNCCEPPKGVMDEIDCATAQTTYISVLGSTIDETIGSDHDLYVSPENFCDYNLGIVSTDYQNYYQKIADYFYSGTFSDPSDWEPYYVNIYTFYDKGLYSYVNDYLLYTYEMGVGVYQTQLSMAYDATSLNFISLEDFVDQGIVESGLLQAYYVYLRGTTFTSESNIKTLEEYADENGYVLLVPTICNNQAGYPLMQLDGDDTDPCLKYQQALATVNATNEHEFLLDEAAREFKAEYYEAGLQAGEKLSMNYSDNEYHFTLYYYDQGGNLVRTVPPKGVVVLNTTGNANIFSEIASKRVNGGTEVPLHTYATKYEYNSLNQLKKQTTPDGGISLFWYDDLGRLRVSQNAVQAAVHDYSYTRYDFQGRIEEVGLIDFASAQTVSCATDAAMDTWLSGGTKKEVTLTYYDIAASGYTQDNLRGRVSYVTNSIDGLIVNHASYYSYDIHGNVDKLYQYNPDMPSGEQNKIIEYEYDLVSGNVNRVIYQRDQKDQFMHQYEYDGDNRIIGAQTSRDGLDWNQDAKYFYYKHGPLARKEIANEKVQGIDFAYTIQGWLKSVNSDNLDSDNDQGNDSKSVGTYSTTNSKIHSAIAKDAFGFSLGYYSGDYTGIKSSAPSHLSDMSSLTDLATNSPDLYNGNISRMVSSIYDDQGAASSQLTAYKYDQLNRIAQMKTYSTLVSNAWSGIATSNYQTAYSYDANGNISNLSRKDNSGVDMDGLSYTYVSGKNQLSSVSDSKTTASITEDFEGTSNYTYDAIGNLISDSGEEIATIDWTVSGKVKKITRNAASIKADMEFIYDAMGNRVAKIVKPKDASGNLLASSQYTSTYYVRDASGNVMATYSKKNNAAFYLDELSIYGSDRLGLLKIDEKLVDLPNMDFSSSNIDYSNTTGGRYYELSNHLGNVLSVVSDRRIAQVTDGVIEYYAADIVSSTDYYPFGMVMPGRSFSSDQYKYGFNGMEKDDEMKGSGNSYDFGARIYDSRLGRWLAVDPLLKASLSSYQFGVGNPISFIDPDGNTEFYCNNKWIGSDGQDNNLVAKVTDRKVKREIKRNTRKGLYSTKQSTNKAAESAVGMFMINKDVLEYSNGMLALSLGKKGLVGEYGNTMAKDGNNFTPTGKMAYENGPGVTIPGEGDVSIHSHPTGTNKNTGETYPADDPSKGVVSDADAFKNFETNIIVGRNGTAKTVNTTDAHGNKKTSYDESDRTAAINIYDKNSKKVGSLFVKEINKMLSKRKSFRRKRFEKKIKNNNSNGS
ncbi:MAG: RHS repeat-associated core domain-containing protein [Bacteroidales bacterium]|nr:RHS repeat-associated core domain-containing protein [Bacteroidales bacterium]